MKNYLRISRGNLKGKKITFHAAYFVRPTQEKVRDSLFNILGSQLKSSVFCDAFAGSGIMGFEAISLGAQSVIFIDKNLKVCRDIKFNQKNLEISRNEIQILNSKLPQIWGLFFKKFSPDFIFMDPPYMDDSLGENCLRAIPSDQISEKTLIILEHHHKMPIKQSYSQIKKFREEKYGESRLSFFRKQRGKP